MIRRRLFPPSLNRVRAGVRFLVLAVVAAGLWMASGCRPAAPVAAKSADTETASAAPREVHVHEVSLQTWAKTVRLQGRLVSYEHSPISTKIAGRVDSVHVELGAPVKRGQTLVVMDTSELKLKVLHAEAQLAQACAVVGMHPDDSELDLNREKSPLVILEQATLKYAEATAARAESLLARGASSQEEIESLVAQKNVADAKYRAALNQVGATIASIGVRRAELALAREQLREATIVAPFDGVVERRHVAQGESVAVGSKMVTLVRVDTLRFTAGVPERAASELREGLPIQILDAGTSQPITATISRVSPSVDPASRVVWIEADLPNPQIAAREATDSSPAVPIYRLRAGAFAEAEVLLDPNERSLSIPAAAITEFAGLEKVFVVRDNVAQEQTIRTGRRREHFVEVVSGLNAGDWVVSNRDDAIAGPVRAIREERAKHAMAR